MPKMLERTGGVEVACAPDGHKCCLRGLLAPPGRGIGWADSCREVRKVPCAPSLWLGRDLVSQLGNAFIVSH